MKRIALLAACFGLTAIAASAADSTKINGWISDSMCGAKHAGIGCGLREEMHRWRHGPGLCGRGEEGGLDHRQSRCGEGFLRRSRDRHGYR